MVPSMLLPTPHFRAYCLSNVHLIVVWTSNLVHAMRQSLWAHQRLPISLLNRNLRSNRRLITDRPHINCVYQPASLFELHNNKFEKPTRSSNAAPKKNDKVQSVLQCLSKASAQTTHLFNKVVGRRCRGAERETFPVPSL